MPGCREKGYLISDETPYIELSDDHAGFVVDSDALFDDALAAIENFSSFSGRINSSIRNVCEGTAVLSNTTTEKKITINYDGTNCTNTKRKLGVVELSIPINQKWKDVGSILTINIKNLIVTRLSDNKKTIFNGVFTIKNVTGGLLKNNASFGSIIHDINSIGGITVEFSNSTKRLWYVSKRRTFSYDNAIVISSIGTHTDGDISGISEWGFSRNGRFFVSSIINPMIVRSDCDYRIVSGEISHERLNGKLNVDFGLDVTGNPTTCPGPSKYYYLKSLYTTPGFIVKTFIMPY